MGQETPERKSSPGSAARDRAPTAPPFSLSAALTAATPERGAGPAAPPPYPPNAPSAAVPSLPQSATVVPPRPPAPPASNSTTPSSAASARASDTEPTVRRSAKRRPAGPARTAIAANDDIPTIGALIYALEQKPSRQPFRVATIVSALWAVLGLGFAAVLVVDLISKSASAWDILAQPVLLAMAATIILPIAVFYFLATLVWRAQELRLMSSAMTEVAVRLAEPDRSAEQSVTSLGQAVRKQVGFMNDAVSVAINRAGELEAMVHNEVSSLGRSFQENETRIRGVLAELANERTQLAASSTGIHATLRAMGDEVPALIEKLNGQQGKLARIIESAGQNLIALEGSLLKASDKLEGSLLVVSEKIEGNLQLASNKLEGTLADRTGHLQQVLDEYTGAINDALGNRTSQMQTVFEEYTKALDATLVERTRALDGAFAERVRLFDDSIRHSTSAIDGVIGEKAIALSAAMENHARQLADALGRQSQDIDETLMHGIDAVRRSSENITKQSVKAIEGLSGQADMLRNVSENLLTQVGSVTNRFENQGQSIMRAANALETANFRIDSTLQKRHAELNETLQKLTGKATELDSVMQGYSANIEGSMSAAETRARSLTQDLSRHAETHARATLADLERVRAETEAQASRALTDMQNQFSSVGREMSTQMGSLSLRLSETSEDLRLKTQRAAADLMAEQARLRAEAERLPGAARETTDAMRRVLQEQVRALDQLTSLSQREAMRRDVTPPAQASLPPPVSLAQAWAGGQPRAPQPPVYDAPPPPPEPQRYAAAGSPMAPQGRWSLGDLLARASEEGFQGIPPPTAPQVAPQGAPQTAPQSVPMPGDPSVASTGAPINLEVIASAVDPDTAAAIWSRYRAGQRGIMVRSIYTPEGRQTFDEVCRRYASEAQFHGTVDKFLADFEALLRESEVADASGRSADAHLASPSGRTYLFLAHAAGRLN